MAQLTEFNRIAIAQICFFVPFLVVAIVLATRHGFGRNAGWLYLIIFSLVRLTGASLELATIQDPTNAALIIASSSLQSIGLSPLILVMLALTGRVLESIRQTKDTFINPRHLRIVQTIVIVALVLGAVGGSKLGTAITSASKHPFPDGSITYNIPAETQAGAALMIVGFATVIIFTMFTALRMRDAQAGEKRLLLSVALAIPFVLVRLIFMVVSTFSGNLNFRSIGGTPAYVQYFLGMSVVMELIAIGIFEAAGLTLQKKVAPRRGYQVPQQQQEDLSYRPGPESYQNIPLQHRGQSLGTA